ncbi:hypothetical protein ACIQVO_37310 [Streptomyces sp. NPDC101062]|uniref:hypothetical protein n=1 Tax=unclassified Streptomyces TaxID=2593676 RepID=UPI003814057D
MSSTSSSQSWANQALADAIAEASCSRSALARRVNEVALSHGVVTRYEAGSVKWWLRGRAPLEERAMFIARALSDYLGREVSPASLGFDDSDERHAVDRALRYGEGPEAGLGTLGEFARADLLDRTDLGAVPFVVSALADVERQWLLWHAETGDGAGADVPERETGPAAEMETVARAFAEVESRFGGAGIRKPAVHYLSSQVAPLVLHGRLPAGQRRRLLTVGAELSALAGWCSYDAGLYGVGQRYLVQALRWCAEGGERALGGQVLAGLAHLAVDRGDAARGVDLARVGVVTSREAVCGPGLMRLYAMSARGHAVLGRAREAEEALKRAESALGQGCGAGECRWTRFLDGPCLETAAADCWLVLGDAGRAEKSAASAAESGGPGRRQVLGLTVLAAAQLHQARLDDALVSAGAALDQMEGLRSLRAVRALRDFRSRLEPHAGERAVRAFLLRAAPLLD